VLPLLPPNGIGVEIESNIPIGKGMGSSASMSIALVQALADIEGQRLTFSELHERGFRLERVFHGTPSGIDHAVSALGGLLCYQRTSEGPRMRQLHTSLPPVVVLDSGSAGNTAEQVEKVQALGDLGAKICADIGTLTASIIDGLAHGDPVQLGQGMTQNHELLRSLGVSNPCLDAMVALCIEAGAHGAKLAGAGGGGVVMAITDQPQSVLAAASQAGYSAFQTSLHPVRMELP
jgi:mevalonate kinase